MCQWTMGSVVSPHILTRCPLNGHEARQVCPRTAFQVGPFRRQALDRQNVEISNALEQEEQQECTELSWWYEDCSVGTQEAMTSHAFPGCHSTRNAVTRNTNVQVQTVSFSSAEEEVGHAEGSSAASGAPNNSVSHPSLLAARIVRTKQWCEMLPCLEDEGCDLLVNRSGWTCTQAGGRIKTTTVS